MPQIIMDENLRLLIKLGYFSLSAIVFIGFNIPFWSEMRNERSYFSNLIKVIKDKEKAQYLSQFRSAIYYFQPFCLLGNNYGIRH